MAKNKKDPKLLLVADISQRNKLASRFRTQNFNVELAVDGFHALNLAENEAYDCIYIYSAMTDMGIPELVSLLKDYQHFGETPILATVNIEDDEEVNAILESGASDIASKEDNFNIIIKRLTGLIKTAA